jgi:hypothetical protein
MCSLNTLVKKTLFVFRMAYVFLELSGKEQHTCVTHSFNTLWCVLMSCGFLALLVKDSRSVQHILTNPLVLLMPFVLIALPVNETA